jgi:hypothetical protein
MQHPLDTRLGRRSFVVGAAASAVLAACGGGNDDDGANTTAAALSPSLSLVQFFDPSNGVVAGIEQRVTFGIGDADGVVIDDVPDALRFTITSDAGPVGEAVEVARHDEGLERPYFPLVFTAPAPGVYTVSSEVSGEQLERSFQVVASNGIPQPGDAMVSVATPTSADPRGVNPICTAEPACPLHDVSLDAALTAGQPVALLVSTPKFCQVRICGPVLDVLLGLRDEFPSVTMLHAEVYTDETTTTTTEAVRRYGLTFEPALFVSDSAGRLATRLDNIYDAAEARAALQGVTA